MKLHLHLVPVQGVTYHVITPRPGTEVRFSTNYYHLAWHIISDPAGARLLARLLWGLSYQKQPNTVIYLGGEFLAPTPFDAEASDPILLTVPTLTPLNEERFNGLRREMGRKNLRTQTIRWQTSGLDKLDPDLSVRDMPEFRDQWHLMRQLEKREKMTRCGGVVCFSAPDLILRTDSIRVARFSWKYFGGMDYLPLAPYRSECTSGAGEIQCFRDYRQMLRDAEVARREVSLKQGEVTSFEEDRAEVQYRALVVRSRRQRSQLARRKRSASNGKCTSPNPSA